MRPSNNIPNKTVRQCIAWAAAIAIGASASANPFASRVLRYDPAPGQFVNDPFFNDPTAALNAPVGGGVVAPDNSKLVSLGGFGGVLVLGFDAPVMDHPSNPLGLDAIVFGNAFWVGGDANRRWAEAAVIEISRDDNANGLADDAWYLIPGSHITDPAAQFEVQTWDDDVADPTHPPASIAAVPPGKSGLWTTSTWRLPALFDATVVENPLGSGATDEGVWGYADFSPTLVLGDLDGDGFVDDPEITPEHFYVTPDDPLTVGVDHGSAGGDAFDIAWAIDPHTNAPAGIDRFHFIRLTAGVNVSAGVFGEKSPEIGGVADAAPGRGDVNCDGVINAGDIDAFVAAITNPDAYRALYGDCLLRNADTNADGAANAGDIDSFVDLVVAGGNPA